MVTLGFIGSGNMGGALARAACKTVEADQVFLANRTVEKAKRLAAELGCQVADNLAVAKCADFIFLGVKPQMMAQMLQEISQEFALRDNRFVLVSMAAGLTIAQIQQMAGGNYPVIRILPNLPVSVGEGIVLYSCSTEVKKTEEELFLKSMNQAGQFSCIEENAASSIAGCGPAFAALFVEALADGGVACGVPRKAAIEYAAQMLLGTAKLMVEEGTHPALLKDGVCSPAGSTIQGVRTLEKSGFRSAVMEAVISAYEKNQALGK